MRRVKAITVLACAAFAAACGDSFLGPAANNDHAAVFDEVWNQLDLHYSFFELKRINWDSLGAHYRPQAIAATTDVQLAIVLSRMLAELKDVHVSITPTSIAGTMRYVSTADTITTYFNSDVVSRRYVPSMRISASGRVRYGMLSTTVGYIRIPSFEGSGWAGDIDAALEALRGATQMVIDVRNNTGGRIALAADIAGRFTDRSRTFGYVRYRNGRGHGDFTAYQDEIVTPSGPRQFTGPMYVLTNRRDFSSAEDFVLAMSANPSTWTIGDTTAGASGGPIVRDLPNGWTFQLSEWIEYTRTKRTFEGQGLAPSIVVRGGPTDALKDVDAVLERVLSLAPTR